MRINVIFPGLLVGIFDGHGGGACAQVISKRLFHYIAASLLPPDMLHQYVASDERQDLIQTFNDKVRNTSNVYRSRTNYSQNHLPNAYVLVFFFRWIL